MTPEESRWHRIEKEIKEISDALRALVRIEERQTSQADGMVRMGVRGDDHEKRIHALEIQMAGNARTISFNERFIWLIITTGVGVAAYFIKG